ncbi:MAG: potassium transporter TrkG [Pseudomonadota bacterium]
MLDRAFSFFRSRNSATQLLIGYAGLSTIGFLLLCLPFMQAESATGFDHFFIATSAVSTTGLVSVDPGSAYTLGGQIVILLLIQLGGIGYLTLGSLIFAAAARRFEAKPDKQTASEFSLPDEVTTGSFLLSVTLYTVICELIGAAILYTLFTQAGVDQPLWSAIFHSISAFCTAGFSLNSDSFASFATNTPVLLTLSTLSILGAIGFLIVWDLARSVKNRRFRFCYTSRVILAVSTILIAAGTFAVFVSDQRLLDFAPENRLPIAFFEAMTASTTVGFNVLPTDQIGGTTFLFIILLMAIGASPSGTGGGLKTTTFAVIIATMYASLRQRNRVRLFGRKIKDDKLRAASSTTDFYILLLLGSVLILSVSETGPGLQSLFFETVSALGTVGLSMGATSELSPIGMGVIGILMIAGRVGILAFGIALVSSDQSERELKNADKVED